jgi:hypothetical protein
MSVIAAGSPEFNDITTAGKEYSKFHAPAFKLLNSPVSFRPCPLNSTDLTSCFSNHDMPLNTIKYVS